MPPRRARLAGRFRWLDLAAWLLVAGIVLAPERTQAIELDTGSDWRVQLNGYIDLEQTRMTKMPMFMPAFGGMAMNPAMGGMFMLMDPRRDLTQKHLNLLLDVERGRFRTHLNFENLNLVTTEDREMMRPGRHLLEAYSEYVVNEGAKIRVGKFLAPFGIFNDIRYITPLYATVVLPFIYVAPGNYTGTMLTPPPAVAMLSGEYFGDTWDLSYAAYVGLEDKERQRLIARDVGRSVGGRLKLNLLDERVALGFSAYTVSDQHTRTYVTATNPAGFQRVRLRSNQERSFGLDLEVELLDGLLLQTEYVRTNFEGAKHRTSYYARLIYQLGRFAPFVMYDVLDDPDDPLYRATHHRLGTGVGVRITNNLYLKGEYHFHWFANDKRLQAIPMMNPTRVNDESQMARFSLIFAF